MALSSKKTVVLSSIMCLFYISNHFSYILKHFAGTEAAG